MTNNYAGDKTFKSLEFPIKIRISYNSLLSATDFGNLLKDIDHLFKVSTREVTARRLGANVKKRDGTLVISDFKAGSLEILADPYVQGVATNIIAAPIVSVFAYLLQRINGKPSRADRNSLTRIEPNLFMPEKLQDAANAAIGASAPQRKRINTLRKTFELEIRVTFHGEDYGPE